MLTDNKSEFENDKGTQIVNEWVAMTADAAIAAPGGALLGVFVGGAPGAAVGASVGSLISHALKVGGMEIWERIQTKRGKVRPSL